MAVKAKFSFVLDTSAVLVHLANEPGADRVQAIHTQSAIPFMVYSELYYITWQRKGKAQADTVYGLMKSWTLPFLMPDEQIMLTAGRLKAMHRLGIADSYIAAFALIHNVPLVTRDPDYEALEPDLQLLKLPYRK